MSLRGLALRRRRPACPAGPPAQRRLAASAEPPPLGVRLLQCVAACGGQPSTACQSLATARTLPYWLGAGQPWPGPLGPARHGQAPHHYRCYSSGGMNSPRSCSNCVRLGPPAAAAPEPHDTVAPPAVAQPRAVPQLVHRLGGAPERGAAQEGTPSGSAQPPLRGRAHKKFRSTHRASKVPGSMWAAP